ncbi:helix-turn-helix domain-containing protein [Salinigranum halophilum]
MTGSGIRAEVGVTGRSVCRIVEASTSVDVVSVSRSASSTTNEVAVEFTADSEPAAVDATEVFSYDGRSIYRFERPARPEPACPCNLIECNGYPVRHTEVNAGTVVLTFVAEDIESLRDVITALKDRYDVSLRYLTRSATVSEGSDLVFVDRSVLTERQREVLETAHEMGYFDHPKRANAEEVADTLEINASTFAEHVSAAQSKLLETILEE